MFKTSDFQFTREEIHMEEKKKDAQSYNKLQLLFFEQLLTKFPETRNTIAKLKREPYHRLSQEILYSFFHSVYGTGMSIGLASLVEPANSIKNSLQDILDTRKPAVDSFLEEITITVNLLELEAAKCVDQTCCNNECKIHTFSREPEKQGQISILVVDDHPVIQQLIYQGLSDSFSLYMADNGKEAFTKLSQVKPQVVITDIVMPVMGGLELIRKIRSHPEFKDIKIIAITVENNKKVLLNAYEAGIDDFVAKPIDSNELITRVRKLLQTA